MALDLKAFFPEEFLDGFWILMDKPGSLLSRMRRSEEVLRFRKEIEEGRISNDDLIATLDSLFEDIKPGFSFDHSDLVCAMVVGFEGTAIEGELIEYFAGQPKAEIMHIYLLARTILKERNEAVAG